MGSMKPLRRVLGLLCLGLLTGAGAYVALVIAALPFIWMFTGARMAVTGVADSGDLSGWDARATGAFMFGLGVVLGGALLAAIPPKPWSLVEQLLSRLDGGRRQRIMTAFYRIGDPLVAVGARARRIGRAAGRVLGILSAALVVFDVLVLSLALLLGGAGAFLSGVTEDGRPDWLLRGGGATMAVVGFCLTAALVRWAVVRLRRRSRLPAG